jgi:hypothetical protein
MKKGENRKNRYGWIGHIFPICILLCICVGVSYWSLFGLLARYTVKNTQSSTARIASFTVSATGEGKKDIISYESKVSTYDYNITVNNDSEVAVSYEVTVLLGNTFPAGVTATLNQKAPLSTTTEADGSTTLKFGVIGTLEVAKSAVDTLTISVDWTQVPMTEQVETYRQEVDFSVSVQFVQID